MPVEERSSSLDAQRILDIDSMSFREQSFSRVHALLKDKLTQLRILMKAESLRELPGFTTNLEDEINRAVVGANERDDIYSTPDTAIMHASGLSIWKKPENTTKIEGDNLHLLAFHLENGQIDEKRAAKGVYFLEVLLHKYKNGNGRTARIIKTLYNKSKENSELSEEETKQLLGIRKETITSTGSNSFKINFNPDFERLILGVAYFGAHKRLTEEQVTKELKLNSSLPEKGLEALANRFGTSTERMKEEFIRFMVVNSDLSWCKFEDEQT